VLKAVFVSLSSGDAEQRMRKILDRYAPRVGAQTWITPISQEGLEIVRLQLKAGAKRSSTAIACYVQRNGRLELEFIVGNRRPFGEQGQAPTKVSYLGQSTLIPRLPFPNAPILLDYAETSGYYHDWGKASRGFQAKLKSDQRTSDPLRHEILSILAYKGQDRGSLRPNRFPAENLLDWIIATHHRLPDSRIKPWEQHQGVPNSTFDLTIPPETLHQMQSEIPAMDGLPSIPMTSGLGQAIFFYGRLALQIADHTVSSNKTILPPPSDPGAVLANSNQELVPHLKAIGKRARLVSRQLLHLSERIPGVWPESRRELDRQSLGRFIWQNQLAKTAAAVDRHAGLCVFLTAETGAGKTRGALKLLSALNENRPLRATVLLGLRSLTLQTGDAYREMGLKDDDLAVLIGSQAVLDMHDDGRDGRVLEVESWDPENWKERLPFPFDEMTKTKSEQAFLAAPVLVCTTDYLAEATNYEKGSHTLAMTRLASADLLLDEVDNYDLSSFHAVLRLVYLAGIFGRRVICSSATLAPELARGILAAYRKGWAAFTRLSGADRKVQILLSHNRTGSRLIDSVGFRAKYRDLHEKAERIRMAEPAIRRGTTFNDWAHLPALIQDAHKNLHQKLKGDYEVSVGLIRCSKLRSVQKQALAISRDIKMGKYGDLTVHTLMLSAQIPLGTRVFLEDILSRVLCYPTPEKLEESWVFEQLRLRAPDAKRHCLLVISTPVIEVGNDLDFDFAVIDPSSSRSILQTAGRVNRHRRQSLPDGVVNVFIATKPVHDRYFKPGYEIKGQPFNGSDDIRKMDADGKLTQLLSGIDLFQETPPDSLNLAVQERRNIAKVVAKECRRLNEYHYGHYVKRTLRSDSTPSVGLFPDMALKVWSGDAAHIRVNWWKSQEHSEILVYNLLTLEDLKDILEFVRGRTGSAESESSLVKKYMRISLPIKELEEGKPICPILGVDRIT